MIRKCVYFLFSISLGVAGFNTQILANDSSTYRVLEWTDLMPASDYEALSNPPDYITESEDDIFSDPSARSTVIEYGDEFATGVPSLDDAYQQALVSQKVIPEMNGKPVRIAGFIVPLEFDDELTVTEFFLVPYFGACIHLPPPPPNQMIYVTYPKGIKLDALYSPFWVSGVLETDVKRNDLGTSAYSMRMQVFEEYSP